MASARGDRKRCVRRQFQRQKKAEVKVASTRVKVKPTIPYSDIPSNKYICSSFQLIILLYLVLHARVNEGATSILQSDVMARNFKTGFPTAF